MPHIISLLTFLLNFSSFVQCGFCEKASCDNCSFLSEVIHSIGKFVDFSALAKAILGHNELREYLIFDKKQKVWRGQINILNVEDFKIFYKSVWSSVVKCSYCPLYTLLPGMVCSSCDKTNQEPDWNKNDFEKYLEKRIQEVLHFKARLE